MRKPLTTSVLLGALLGVGPIQAQTATAPAPAARTSDLERRFDPLLDPAEMTGWLRTMTAEPNQVGSPHDRANADMVLSLFREWGWDAHIETFQVLYPTPVTETLELIAPTRFKATLTEPPIPGDASSARTANVLPADVAYQTAMSPLRWSTSITA